MLFILLSEVATHKQIEYTERDGIKYGFVPSANKRYGFMKFKPGATKPFEKSSGQIVSKFYSTFISNEIVWTLNFINFFSLQYMHVLQGLFTIQTEDGEDDMDPASETTIQKGVRYALVNQSKNTGVIQFEYAA